MENPRHHGLVWFMYQRHFQGYHVQERMGTKPSIRHEIKIYWGKEDSDEEAHLTSSFVKEPPAYHDCV